MTPTIQFATPADAELILHFIRGLAEYEHEAGAVARDEWTVWRLDGGALAKVARD